MQLEQHLPPPAAGSVGLIAMPFTPSRPYVAYCEEYNEDAHTTIPDTRQSANVAAKRSKPDIVRSRMADAGRDEFSDSGYSSRTGATLGSGDSSLASKAEAAVKDAGINTSGIEERKVGTREEAHSAPQHPRKPSLRRTESKAKGGTRRQSESSGHERSAAVQYTSKSPEKAMPSAQKAVKQTSRAAPAITSAPKSTKPPQPNPAEQAPFVQPAQVRPRPTTAQSYRTGRPMSFHAGISPQISYMPPLYIPPVANPPPPQAHQIQSPHAPSYFMPQPSPVHAQPYSFPPSPYEPQPRPLVRQWTSEQPQPYRHSLVYSAAPVIEYSQQPTYAPVKTPAHYAPGLTPAPAVHQSQPRERRYSRDEDYYRMPPPPPPPKKAASEPLQNQRPSIRHAATTTAALHRHGERAKDHRHHTKDLPSPKKERHSAREASRRPSVAKRPSATSSNHSASSNHALERDMGRLSIDSERAEKKNRRMSYHGHEADQELEQSAEAYQAATGTDALPMTADSLKLIRKKTASSKSSSHVSGSARGSKAGSEAKSRTSTDRRGSDKKTRNDNDGLTMRFNASHGVNLDLKGEGMEGRTISLRQSQDGGDGNMEFSIGSKDKTRSKSDPKEKSRKKYSLFGGSSSIREVEPAVSGSRSRRDSKADEDSKSRTKKVASSRSRRSSRSTRG